MTLLDARALARQFGGVTAVSRLDLAVGEGELVGLIGPNGAGKTTAFNLLSGVTRPSSGTVRFAGSDVTRAPPERRARMGLTRTFQNIRLFDELSALDNVKAGAHARLGASPLASVLGLPAHARAEDAIEEAARAALDRVGAAALADRPAGALAYGERRLVEIARALAAGPRLLLLDEPAAGMNAGEKAALSTLLRRLHGEGLAMVLVEHDVRLVAALCPRVVVMHRGEVLADGPAAETLAEEAVAEVYLGRRGARAARAAAC